MSLLDHIRASYRSFNVWLNAVLLAAYPFADSIISGIHDHLPELAPYLPANVFQAVGLALVIYNIVHGAHAAAKAAKAAQ
jgi:hypothetical protein